MMRRMCSAALLPLAVVAGIVPVLTWSLATPLRVAAAVGDITTYAGVSAYGDEGMAVSATLGGPAGVLVEKSGAIDIADTGDGRIRRVDPASGLITTIAGTTLGTGGSAIEDPLLDDGHQATTVVLSYVWGMAADGHGGLYFSEYSLDRVRHIDAGGVITTVAGTRAPTLGFDQCFDGQASNAGLIGDGSPATLACLQYPKGLATDAAGNLYIADALNGRIRRVDTSGIISTVAGGGTCGALTGQSYCGDGGPATAATLSTKVDGVAVDGHGNVYLSDGAPNCAIRVVNTSGIISTLAGGGGCGSTGDGGDARLASLSSPEGLLISGGTLYVADAGNNRVRAIDLTTHRITAVAGYGARGWSPDGWPAAQARFDGPTGMAVDAGGNLLIADQLNNEIIRVDAAAPHRIRDAAGARQYCGSADGIPADRANLCGPEGVAADAAGEVVIADRGGDRIRRIAPDGTITTLAGPGDGSGGCPPVGDGGPAAKANLCGPLAVTLDGAGNIYFIDQGHSAVFRIDHVTGIITTVAGGGTGGDGGPAASAGLSGPQGLAVDGAGNVYIAEYQRNRVRMVSHGVITTVAGGCSVCTASPADEGEAAIGAHIAPTAVAVDGRGRLLIADSSESDIPGNSRVRRVEDGKVHTIAGLGAPGDSGDGGPATSAALGTLLPSIVVDPDDQSILISDSDNGRIRRVDAQTGTITTIAGSGTEATTEAANLGIDPNYCGDGGPAMSACLGTPAQIALAQHRLYIAEFDRHSQYDDGHRVRVVTLAAPAHAVSASRSTLAGTDRQRTLAAMTAVWARLGLDLPRF